MKSNCLGVYPKLKRLIDLVLATIIIIIFLPFWFIIPLVIWLDSGRPVMYRHKRIGQNGKEFWLYKFRSMVKNADEVLYKKDKKLLAKFKKNDWKLEHDPRITKLGRILRSLTIDEFPQLWNVLRGEMSVIGPRAYIKKEIDDQTKKYPVTKKRIKKILTVKPGITGPWQTSGRNIISFDKRTAMDLNYSNNYNFWWDMSIVFKTPKAMLSKW